MTKFHLRQHVPTIGLVGGIASGKSFVANILVELGCASVDADRIGHEVLDDPLVKLQIRQEFGDQVFTPSGSLDREKLSGVVFSESQGEAAAQRRSQLELIVHPAIRTEALNRIRGFYEMESPPRAIVIDAPLLIEAGWSDTCDEVLFVDTPEPVRRQRALDRGWTETHWAARQRSQMNLEKKRQAATHIVPGDAQPDDLRVNLESFLKQIEAKGSEKRVQSH